MERTYHVRFYKKLLSSNGHQFEPLQADVEVRALDRAEAIELGREKFAAIAGVQHWSLRADYEKVECVAEPSTRPSGNQPSRTSPTPQVTHAVSR